MPFSQVKTYVRPACTPTQVAEALAQAFEAANGAGSPFSVHSLKYDTSDGVRYSKNDPTLGDLAALQTLPPQLDVTAFGAGGDLQHVLATFRKADVALSMQADTAEGLRKFCDRFAAALGMVETSIRAPASSGGTPAVPDVERPRRTEPEGPTPLLIFTALQEERKVLEEALGLKTYEDGVARGVRHGLPIELISSKKMGRVPAAVAIATHLARSPVRFRLIVAAGLAGGFAESNTQRGAVVIASEIVDLATRKEHETRTEFRPAVFQLDDTLGRYVRSSAFDREKWEKAVLARDEWPQHLRPHIVEGVLACTDEIVSSDAWRSELITAWAKLLGIEMESGGACAAAEAFGMKIAVIRGVSDLADPRKSDDLWRRLAMRAVAETLDALIASNLLLTPVG